MQKVTAWLSLLLFSLPVAAQGAATAEDITPHDAWIKAINHDDVGALSELLDGADITLTNGNGKSALMVAIKTNNRILADALLDGGAHIARRTHTGGSAIMYAALGNHVDMAEWLLARDAVIDEQSSNGWTAVMIAAARGHVAMLAWLLEHGANPDTTDIYRHTPLMRAVINGHYESAELLLQHSSSAINARDETGNTALQHARAADDDGLVELLLQHGAH